MFLFNQFSHYLELTPLFPQLKDEVCSPGGVTINAIYSMEKAGVRAAMMDAVDACVKRNYELARYNE